MIKRFITINGKEHLGYAYPSPTNAEQAWELIKLERRLRSQEGGYKVGDKWYHSDQASKMQQMGLLLLGSNLPTSLMWKTMDGSFTQMTPQLALQIFQTASTIESLIFAKAEEKKAQVIASGDFVNFNYFSDWPIAYWELP